MHVSTIVWRFTDPTDGDAVRLRATVVKGGKTVEKFEQMEGDSIDNNGLTWEVDRDVDAIVLEAGGHTNSGNAVVYVNHEKAHVFPPVEKDRQWRQWTWKPPLLQRPVVQAGLGVVGVAVATGLIGKWLDWW